MAADNWQTTRESAAFDEKGKLRDGGHRLHAIIENRVSMEISVRVAKKFLNAERHPGG